MPSEFTTTDQSPTWRELEQVLPLDEAEALTSLSRDTIVRRYPQYVVRLSPRRLGIKLRNALRIAGTTIDSEADAA